MPMPNAKKILCVQYTTNLKFDTTFSLDLEFDECFWLQTKLTDGSIFHFLLNIKGRVFPPELYPEKNRERDVQWKWIQWRHHCNWKASSPKTWHLLSFLIQRLSMVDNYAVWVGTRLITSFVTICQTVFFIKQMDSSPRIAFPPVMDIF